MIKYNGLDVYEMLVDGENTGIFFVSLVDEPAIERNFVCFSKENESECINLSIQNEEKRLISGVIISANYPILRINGDYKYYILYKPETIQKMAEKMLYDGTFRNVDIMHNQKPVEGVKLVELYIKDSSKGITPNFVEDVPEGSLMGTFHVENDALWDEIKNGDFLKGFSIGGFWEPVQLRKDDNNNEINNEEKMKNLLKKLLVKLASVETEKGTLYFADELAVGVEVFVDNENVEPAADGEYAVEDGRIVVVADGKVTEIKEAEKEEVETPAEEKVEAEEEVVKVETPAEPTEPEKDEVAELKAEVESLKAEIEAIKETIAKIVEQPAGEPVEEQFEKVKVIDEKGLTKGVKKAIDMLKNRK